MNVKLTSLDEDQFPGPHPESRLPGLDNKRLAAPVCNLKIQSVLAAHAYEHTSAPIASVLLMAQYYLLIAQMSLFSKGCLGKVNEAHGHKVLRRLAHGRLQVGCGRLGSSELDAGVDHLSYRTVLTLF